MSAAPDPSSPVLIVALALAAAHLTPAPGQHARRDTSRPVPPDTASMMWVVGRDQPRARDVVEAWLVVPAERAARDSAATLRILSPSDADVWLRDAGATCRDAEAARRTEHIGRVERDTILYVCVRPREVGTTRLVAVRRLTRAGVARQEIATSQPITARERYTIGAGWLAVLTAVVGFLTGVLAHVIQALWDRRQTGKRDERELKRLVAEHLVEEMRGNLHRLEAWLDGSSSEPPDMAKKEYNSLLGDDGLLSYLGADERARYWRGVQEIYALMERYTDQKNLHHAAEARAIATTLRHRLTNHLRGS
ncbi:MAG TPA: hypothetical protein VFK13_05875 [Gemmatimonadaceae bacterium]|nr:hypothetical protein [Gemmatimonadaceae bacterium]